MLCGQEQERERERELQHARAFAAVLHRRHEHLPVEAVVHGVRIEASTRDLQRAGRHGSFDAREASAGLNEVSHISKVGGVGEGQGRFWCEGDWCKLELATDRGN